MAKPFAPQVLTANTLRVGDVVYLAADGAWLPDLSAATVATDTAQLAALEASAAEAVAAQEIVAVYAIDVDTSAGTPAALSVKERIRAARGPTV